MPRTNIDYSNTIIYKLCCKDITITEIYIGHTTDMRKRKNRHKSNCNNETNKHHNLNVYKFIRDNGNWDNWDMIEIERFEAIDGYDAKKRERYWIEELKASLNSCIPTRTYKEYRENNKEKIAEYKKLYRKNNKITNKEEAEANERAAQILMPEDAIIQLARLTGIIKLVEGKIDIDLLWLDYLSKKFQVSKEAFTIRLAKLSNKILPI